MIPHFFTECKKFVAWLFCSLLTVFLAFHQSGYAIDTISKKAIDHYPKYPKIDYGSGNEAEFIRRGEYLVQVGDCIGCHTDPGRHVPAFAGGAPIPTPFGDFYGPNITPDQKTGLGNWTEKQFIRAMREGIAPDGSHYFPVFPYVYFNKMSLDDIRAIWAYLQRIPAVYRPNESHTVPFPMSIRFLQYGWKMLFFYPYRGEMHYDAQHDPAWNRGAYLTEGAGHCAMCHTPINILGATKRDYHLTGNFIEGYWAPNITSTGLERSSVEEVSEIFSKGRLSLGAGPVAGPMAEVNHNSLSKLTPSDQLAIAHYLKTVKSKAQFKLTDGYERPSMARGKVVYEEACATCHQHGQAGAPRMGDSYNWVLRAEKGLDTLYQNTINGYNSMPTKGACVTCHEHEIEAAVDYLLYKSLTRANKEKVFGVAEDKSVKKRSGKKIYQQVCSVCHDSGKLSAPKIGDVQAWAPYRRKNFDTLVKRTLRGSYRMPKRGGCSDCSTGELVAAIKYILEKSQDKEKDYSLWKK